MEEYTERHGMVVSVEPEQIVVRVDRKMERGCDGCRACALKSLCRGREDGHMDLPVPVSCQSKLRPGEIVRIRYRLPNQALAALVMFIPPLLGLVGGGLAGFRLGWGGDMGLVMFCLFGLACGVGCTYLLSRSGAALRPEIALVGSGEGG